MGWWRDGDFLLGHLTTLRQLSLSTRDCFMYYLEADQRVHSRIVN